MRLEVAPPGQAAIITIPTFIAGERFDTVAKTNAIMGNKIIWQHNPMSKALG